MYFREESPFLVFYPYSKAVIRLPNFGLTPYRWSFQTNAIKVSTSKIAFFLHFIYIFFRKKNCKKPCFPPFLHKFLKTTNLDLFRSVLFYAYFIIFPLWCIHALPAGLPIYPYISHIFCYLLAFITWPPSK